MTDITRPAELSEASTPTTEAGRDCPRCRPDHVAAHRAEGAKDAAAQTATAVEALRNLVDAADAVIHDFSDDAPWDDLIEAVNHARALTTEEAESAGEG